MKTALVSVGMRGLSLLETEVLRTDVANTNAALEARRRKQRRPSAAAARAEGVGRVGLVGNLVTDVRVIEPACDIGSDLDFDSYVKPGWPGPQTPGRVRIMQARFDYGVKVVKNLPITDPNLDAMLKALSSAI